MESWNNITWSSGGQKYIREVHFRLHNKSWLLLSRINQIKTLTDFWMRGIKISTGKSGKILSIIPGSPKKHHCVEDISTNKEPANIQTRVQNYFLVNTSGLVIKHMTQQMWRLIYSVYHSFFMILTLWMKEILNYSTYKIWNTPT